jgi:hypothetical protein
VRLRNLKGAVASALVFLLAIMLGTPLVPRAQSLSNSDCSTAQLSDVMAVYLSVPVPRATPPPIPPNVRSYLSNVLLGRLAACQRGLGVSEERPCEPNAGESNQPSLLWTHLRFCELLVKGPPLKTPSVIPWQLPGLGLKRSQPVIFVMGAGADTAVVSKLISTLTVYLNDGKESAGYHFTDDAILVPEPSWTTDVYANQCENSPNVEGAIVVNVTAAGSGASDEFISRRNWSAIEATAMYAQCTHASSSPGGVPSFVWASNIDQEESHRNTFTPLLPLSLLLTLGAMYEEFVPQRTLQITSKKLFPAPTPFPKTGYQSEKDTANTTTLNAAQVGSIAGGFLTSSISYTNTSNPLTQQPTLDQQTWNIVQSVAIKLIGDMNCWQATPEPIGSRSASDIIGPARSLPGYSPPSGIGAFRTGRASAPFCGETGLGESVRIVLPDAAPATPALPSPAPPRRP